jgi:hypothetical protein
VEKYTTLPTYASAPWEKYTTYASAPWEVDFLCDSPASHQTYYGVSGEDDYLDEGMIPRLEPPPDRLYKRTFEK